MKKILFLASILWYCALPAGAESLSADLQAALITKILMYENHASKNAKNNTLVIGVLSGEDEKSAASAKAISAALLKLKAKGAKINSLAIDVAQAKIAGSSAVVEELKSKNVNALYIAAARPADISVATSVSQEMKIVSIIGDDAEKNVAKGVAVGLAVESNKPVILVNINAALKEGCDFAAQFLQLVKLVK
ncbi:MAG: hypothetical protein A2219_01530 [Elusimicrobia bacterium RIFOXYA2_FULL_50_26]|nr:MAG: hypothetical protein A2219_01530 [Elusimicrobia bacterium RIFOXYA2_FULL_50_26]OGS23930.1 MAG: hypothetical protein A2314_07700 [Elusimicrobia bacterium RIFOXYB2_FULL_50_12]